MDFNTIITGLAGVIVSAGPLVFAAVGETFAERSGVINLSLNGTIILTAMSGFVVALSTNNLVLGALFGMLVGGLSALIIAFASITLKQSQVAVGFVLTLMNASLAYFLGNPYVGVNGPSLGSWDIPMLSQIPVLGPLLFRADVLTYLSYLFIIFAWIWLYKTRSGLILQGIGERPAAAFVRGANVNRMRYIYTVREREKGIACHYRGGIFFECQIWLDGYNFRSGRFRLDRTGNHYFWRMEPFARSLRRIPVCVAAVAWPGTAAGHARCPLPGSAGGTFSIDDPDPAAGQYWRYRMG